MELKELEHIDPMTVDFHGLNVTFNPDAFVPGFFYQAAERLRAQFAPIAKPETAAPESKTQENDNSVVLILEDVARRIHQKGDVEASERAYYISLLTGTPENPVLLSWDLTHEGQTVPCNAEGLSTFKYLRTLRDLWDTIRDAPLPKSRGIATIPQNQTTNGNTPSPSATPATPAEESPIM